MLVLICKNFLKYDKYGRSNGDTELLVDCAVDYETLQNVVVPCDHPSALGAVMDRDLGEWVIREP